MEEFKINDKPIKLNKTILNPEFGSKTVLVNDAWDFVEMFLKRNSKGINKNAIFFWQQSKQFAEASKLLPLTSSPLTNYYSFLNATKALLIYKSIPFSEVHGVSGNKMNKNVSLNSEKVKFKTAGILPALTSYIENKNIDKNEEYTLREIFYNLAYIHRAYCLTFKCEELFLPLKDPRFLKRTDRSDVWFVSEIDENYKTMDKLDRIPGLFNVDVKDLNNPVLQYKKFKYKGSTKMQRLQKNHHEIRCNVQYVYGNSKMWYLKLEVKPEQRQKVIDRNPLTLIYAAMHRLSELSRYNPDLLQKHFNSSTHNWLLTEFIRTSPSHFIDLIASEITGYEFMPSGYVSR